ncbi:cupin [Streptomyces sp. NPDC087219]|uniref:cupin n=1 Tax=Streptomyces sp. NPDC087219 TaxID=3365770 RepID=UPI0038295A4A
MHVITPSPESVTVSPDATMTGLAAPSRGSAELSTWTVEMAAGATGPEHTISREQVWTVTNGTLEVTCGGRTEKVAARPDRDPAAGPGTPGPPLGCVRPASSVNAGGPGRVGVPAHRRSCAFACAYTGQGRYSRLSSRSTA